MDATDFDYVTRSITTGSSRRTVLHLAAAALGLPIARVPSTVGAKSKKKPKPNAFGCLNVGQPCRGKDAKCCSGICHGKKPKKGKKDTSRCVAHDASGCLAGGHPCNTKSESCTTSLGFDGICFTTTGNAGFCASDSKCQLCSRDANCRSFFGPRAACVVCMGCPEGTSCVAPG